MSTRLALNNRQGPIGLRLASLAIWNWWRFNLLSCVHWNLNNKNDYNAACGWLIRMNGLVTFKRCLQGTRCTVWVRCQYQSLLRFDRIKWHTMSALIVANYFDYISHLFVLFVMYLDIKSKANYREVFTNVSVFSWTWLISRTFVCYKSSDSFRIFRKS